MAAATRAMLTYEDELSAQYDEAKKQTNKCIEEAERLWSSLGCPDATNVSKGVAYEMNPLEAAEARLEEAQALLARAEEDGAPRPFLVRQVDLFKKNIERRQKDKALLETYKASLSEADRKEYEASVRKYVELLKGVSIKLEEAQKQENILKERLVV